MKTKIYIGDTIYVGCKADTASETATTSEATEAQHRLETRQNSIGWCERPNAKPISEELKQQFIDYFMTKYPITKKINFKRRGHLYRVQVYYKEERQRTFEVWARTYEMLVVKMRMWYQFREIPSVHGW